MGIKIQRNTDGIKKVYIIYFEELPNECYIGETVKLLRYRLNRHKSEAYTIGRSRKEKWLRRNMDNGFNPKIKLLCKCKSPKHALRKEAFYIRRYKLRGYKLWNSNDGGKSSKSKYIRKETRQKISKSKKLYHFTDKHIANIKKNHASNKAIQAIDIITDEILTFRSIIVAGEQLGISHTRIRNYIRRKKEGSDETNLEGFNFKLI